MSNLVLFLDVDGVLHPLTREPGQLYRSVPLLEEVLRGYPDIEVVISSDRRIHESLDELRKRFSPDIRPRIIDVNPFADNFTELEDSMFPADLFRHPRQKECLAWLADHRPGGRTWWVAIDDTVDHFHPMQTNIYWVDGTRGLEVSELKQLKDFLALQCSGSP